jgi:glutamate racemase
LGDNARTPYGTRSFDVVYKFTLECVKYLFSQGCQLVILACNTASAKALRTIQQNDLPKIDSERRVLGVIRPTVEEIGNLTKTNHVGLLATSGTVQSDSYPIEIHKIFPEIEVTSQACPLLVPLIENNEHKTAGADFFIKKYVDELINNDKKIDTVILGCTHYPLISEQIKSFLPDNVNVISQGELVAKSLKDYLQRHPEMEEKCTKNGMCNYLTTENPEKFSSSASIFLSEDINAQHIEVSN